MTNSTRNGFLFIFLGPTSHDEAQRVSRKRFVCHAPRVKGTLSTTR